MPHHLECQRWRFVFAVSVIRLLLAAVLLHASVTHTQAEPDHHPSTPDTSGISKPAPPTLLPSFPPAGAANDEASGMGGMMGVRPQKELYPSLMALPTISPEQRQSIEAQARARINEGTKEISSAENALRHATAAGDAAGVEQAALRLHEAFNQVKSGSTILRSLAEGKPPQQIAMDWYKGQLNLTPASLTHGSGELSGISWFHLVTMFLVTAFAAGMLAIHLIRMRRATALVDRLASVNPVSSTPAAPAGAAPTAPSGVAAAPATAMASSFSAPAAMSATPAPAPERMPRGGLWKGQLRVAAIFRETTLVKTFRLRDPQGEVIPFSFLPGQFLTFSAEIDGKRVRRSYTIASSAAQTAYVDTTIKREEAGVFSEYMHNKIVEGDLVDVMGPSGVFTFRGTEADSLVLIGGGVGITPLMAVIRYLADTAWPREIFLVYGARSTEEFIFREELEYRQRRMRNLHVAATMTRSAGTSWMGAEGPITKEFLTQSVPDIAKRHVHLCGPPGMMAAMKKLLPELGVPAEQVMTEAFGPAMGAVPPPGFTEVTPIQPIAGQAAPDAASPHSAGPTIGPATATIRFSKSNKDVPLAPDKSVLETAESVGVPIDYQCRVGTCGICKIQLLEGKVSMEVEDALTPEDRTQNLILACQAKSIGNLIVEA